MESVRVLTSDPEMGDYYVLMTVVDDVAYVAPIGSEPFDVAPAGVWFVAEVTRTPAWA
jgi:hypothetical protein